MQKPKISIIVAITRKDAAIGNGGKLLFHISDDLKQFKALTSDHPVIMGRKTFESIGRPLPERTNIVITRNTEFRAEGVLLASSLEDAIQKASSLNSPLIKGVPSRRGGGCNIPPAEDGSAPFSKGDSTNEIFIIGGGEIYRQALPYTDKLYLTIVESDAKGDVFFPTRAGPSGRSYDWREDFTKEVFREERFDDKTGLKYTWVDLERK